MNARNYSREPLAPRPPRFATLRLFCSSVLGIAAIVCAPLVFLLGLVLDLWVVWFWLAVGWLVYDSLTR